MDVDALIARLSTAEKIRLVSGEEPFWTGIVGLLRHDRYHQRPFVAARHPALGLPGLAFVDGPRGVVLEGGATTFPVAMARGATWNPALEEQIGEAIGREVRALGANLFGGVCVNLLRHPGWGRAQETYGEDPVHVGEMGAALVRGVARHAMACVKHLALNSIENARFRVDVKVAPRPLHELYLPAFRACVEAGATAVMSAYNRVNGDWCGESRALLTDILKRRWGFSGFVLTDFLFGLRHARRAIDAGLDLEMPFAMVLADGLPRLLAEGHVAEARLDDAVRRLIGPQLALSKAAYARDVVGCAAHRALAREAAVQSMVLLEHDGETLPLPADARLAVVGRLASVPNLGDRGSSDGRPPSVVTPLQGLQEAFPDVAYVPDPRSTGWAPLDGADAVIVVVGYTHEDEGELVAPDDLAALATTVPPPGMLARIGWLRPAWRAATRAFLSGWRWSQRRGAALANGSFGQGGDRRHLGLRPDDEALIAEVCARHERVVVVLMGGSAILMERWRHLPSAILLAWYPGMEGGHALADLLRGARSPSGRLPFVIPRAAAHLPDFDPDADTIVYDLWHGYRKLARDGVGAAFPFGFGRSYTTFAYGPLAAERGLGPAGALRVSLDVRNEGARPGDEVVQIYVRPVGSAVPRAPEELKGFTRVSLAPGETRRVSVEIPQQRLAYFDEEQDAFVVEALDYEVAAARHAADPDASVAVVTLRPSARQAPE